MDKPYSSLAMLHYVHSACMTSCWLNEFCNDMIGHSIEMAIDLVDM